MSAGAKRMLEIAEHPFHVATHFVPHTRPTMKARHPLITEFLRAAARR